MRKVLVLGACIVLPSAVYAQTPGPTSITGSAAPQGVSTATLSEQFQILNPAAAIKLRFHDLLHSSEVVTLDGAPITKSVDYAVDYISGTIRMVRAVNPGQVLKITYSYSTVQSGFGPAGSLTASGMTKTALIGSDLRMGMDLGGNGTHLDDSLSASLYGWNNSLQIGRVSTNGLVLFSTRKTSSNAFMNTPGSAASSPIANDSQFILQNLATKMGGGSISLTYQDISPNFNAFDSVKGAGFESSAVDQLQKEAGLKRMGFAMDNVAVAGVKISNDFHTVTDGGGSIDWKKVGIQSGGLKLDFSSQRVGLGFNRFSDLAEKDRDTLMKEAGLSRQSFSGEYKTKTGGLSFTSNSVKDDLGQTVQQRLFAVNTSKWKLSMGDQAVDAGFSRMDSLTESEKTQWSKDLGLQRQWFAFEVPLPAKGAQPIKADINKIEGPNGGMTGKDFSAGGKNWTVQLASQKVDSQFGMLGSLADKDVDSAIKAIAGMYAPNNAIASGPGDRPGFVGAPPVERSGMRFTANPKKGWNLDIESVQLKGQLDSARLDTVSMTAKNFDVYLKREKMGAQFTEAPLLLGFEQQKLGNVPGLDRMDFALNWTLKGAKKLAIASLVADTPAGDARRQSLSYTDKKIDLSISTRNVDPGFNSASGLSDPEVGLLTGLAGFKERDIKAKWQVLSNLRLDAVWEDQTNDFLGGQQNYTHNIVAAWDPNKTTHLLFTSLDSKSSDPNQLFYQGKQTAFSFFKDFGKNGKVQYLHETDSNANTNTVAAPINVSGAPTNPVDPNAPQGDSTKDYVSYERQLDKKTSFKTEESSTHYSDGKKEDMSANTISRSLTDHFGLSFTDLRIARSGENHDETKHNYGFWIDLAKGMRFSYGYVRDINNLAGNTLNSTIGLTAGNLGPIHVDGASSSLNAWDQLHNQATTNMQIKSSKPFRLGFIKEAQFNVGVDTASDYSAFTRDTKIANFSGKVGSNSFMLEYKSILDATGFRGIDRFVKFETDQNPKRLLNASIKIKQRNTPNEGLTLIRDYTITARPVKNLEISNQMLTNPEEQFRGDVLMGSTTSPWRVNKLKLNYLSGKSTIIGATWEDRFNDYTREFSRTGGINAEFFKNTGYPLTFFYGLEQGGGLTPRQTAQRYYVRYNQKPGPNQVFSIFAGNISYEYTKNNGFSKDNWTIHMDYELRFW